MKYFTHNQLSIDTNYTSFQGSLRAQYPELVYVFGKPLPDGEFDNYKSDAEWHVQFKDGQVATIYNWKNGRNYCGPDAPATEDITEWNIGGKTRDVVQRIHSLVRGDVTGTATILPLP